MKWLNWLKKLFWEKEETSLFYMQGHDVLPQPLSSSAMAMIGSIRIHILVFQIKKYRHRCRYFP